MSHDPDAWVSEVDVTVRVFLVVIPADFQSGGSSRFCPRTRFGVSAELQPAVDAPLPPGSDQALLAALPKSRAVLTSL